MVDELARVVKMRKRSRLGRAASNSGGSASRLSAVSTLKVSTACSSQAALVLKYFEGITPPASSFLMTSCAASMEPAFWRCHWSNFFASQSRKLVSIW